MFVTPEIALEKLMKIERLPAAARNRKRYSRFSRLRRAAVRMSGHPFTPSSCPSAAREKAVPLCIRERLHLDRQPLGQRVIRELYLGPQCRGATLRMASPCSVDRCETNHSLHTGLTACTAQPARVHVAIDGVRARLIFYHFFLWGATRAEPPAPHV